MADLDQKTIDRNIDEANEIYRAGVTPTHKDIQWTGAEKLRRDRELKQFSSHKGESGSDPFWVVTDAYRKGYDAIDWSKK